MGPFGEEWIRFYGFLFDRIYRIFWIFLFITFLKKVINFNRLRRGVTILALQKVLIPNLGSFEIRDLLLLWNGFDFEIFC